PAIYGQVAKNRLRISQACSLTPDQALVRKATAYQPDRPPSKLTNVFYGAYAAWILVFVVWVGHPFSNTPYLPGSSDFATQAESTSRKLGLEIPIVFNTMDLTMGNRWMLLYRKTRDDKDWQLTPLTGPNGERMTYLGVDILGVTNHNSDTLYFGTTLPYRRQIIEVKPYEMATFHDDGPGYNSMLRRIEFDYGRLKLLGRVQYRIEVFENQSSEVSLFSSSPAQFNGHRIYAAEYIYNGDKLTKRKRRSS
ncbi:MAG: hypothetical protein ABUL72_02700, partial [Armatimonadota bacterium]